MTRWSVYVFVLLTGCGAIGAGSGTQEPNRKPRVGSGPAIHPKGYLVQEIRGSLYWVSDGALRGIQHHVLVTSNGVIAIDAPPTLGPNYVRAIAEVTSQPITYLVYSHEHTDHIGAAHLFPKGVRIVAQKETAEILAHRKDPRRPVPTLTFTDTYTLKLGGQNLVLAYPGINHERGNFHLCSEAKDADAGRCGLSGV